MHSDIKPANILLDADENVKIGDFSLAMSLETPDTLRFGRRGTLSYMAPEMFQENGYDKRVDVWSLGVTM